MWESDKQVSNPHVYNAVETNQRNENDWEIDAETVPAPQAQKGIRRQKDWFVSLNRHFSQIFDRFWLQFHDDMISIFAVEVVRTEPEDGGLVGMADQFDRKIVLVIEMVVVGLG